MIKFKHILIPAAILMIIAFYYLRTDEVAAEIPPVEEPVERILTKMDTLVFEYDSILSHYLDSLGSVGAAVVITYKDEIAFLKCYGVKEAGGNDSVDAETVFRLASVSKTITGVLAGILSEERIIPLDDKVIDYLPGFRLKDSVSTYELSVRNILSHTSGLVPHAYDNLVEAHVPFSVILDSLYRVNISDRPGRLYGYQNVVFSLYDTIASVKTSMSFDELLHKKLFGPFGMNQASAGYEPFVSNDNKAFPHNRNGATYKPLKLNDRYYNTNPAAGINASISDMGQFLLGLSGGVPSEIKPTVAKAVLSPQIKTPLRWNYLRKWNHVESKHYGIGWRIIGYQGRQVAYHGGYVQGYQAEIALCLEEEIGITFLTNSPNGAGSMSVPLFLDMYFEMNDSTGMDFTNAFAE